MRNILLTLLIGLALTGLACDLASRNQTTVEPRDEPASPTEGAAPSEADDESRAVMATVNGQPIPLARLHDALVVDFGKPIAQQFVASEVVRQKLIAEGIPTKVSEEELRAETVRAMKQIIQFEDNPTWEQVVSLRDQFLRQRSLTSRIWDATMRRNVQLTRLAARHVTVSPEELRQAYRLRYGAKWHARHIQVPHLETAQTLLDQVRDGADFAKLAFKHSTNPDAKDGGLMPPITLQDPPSSIPKPIVQAVLAMDRPGAVSNPVQAGTNFHILKLEKVEPPADVEFQDVRAELKADVRDAKIAQLQQQLLQRLIAEAEIVYIDPTLREVMQQGDRDD
jgi:parvulin-like peptidyl-prolyl isomerase